MYLGLTNLSNLKIKNPLCHTLLEIILGKKKTNKNKLGLQLWAKSFLKSL